MTYGLSDVFADSKPCTIEDVKNTLLEKNISQLWTFLKGAAFYNNHQMLKYILDLNICTNQDFHMFKYLCELNIYDMHKNAISILYFLAKSTAKKSVMIMEYMEKNYHDILDSANMRPIFDRCRRIASQHDNIYFMKIFKRYIKNG